MVSISEAVLQLYAEYVLIAQRPFHRVANSRRPVWPTALWIGAPESYFKSHAAHAEENMEQKERDREILF